MRDIKEDFDRTLAKKEELSREIVEIGEYVSSILKVELSRCKNAVEAYFKLEKLGIGITEGRETFLEDTFVADGKELEIALMAEVHTTSRFAHVSFRLEKSVIDLGSRLENPEQLKWIATHIYDIKRFLGKLALKQENDIREVILSIEKEVDQHRQILEPEVIIQKIKEGLS